MSNDFRIEPGFVDHHKTVRLRKLAGDDAVFCLMRLWGFAGQYRHKGVLSRMNVKDIEIAAKWTGEVGDLVSALVEAGFLNKLKNGLYRLHNWKKRQPFIYGYPERSAQARVAAKTKRTKGHNNLRPADEKNPLSPLSVSSPSPSPLPSPSPIPKNNTEKKSRKRDDKGKQEKSSHHQFKIFWVSLFKDRRHDDYVFQGGKDGKVIKDMLAVASLEELKDLARVYLDWDDKFLHGAGYTLGLMLIRLNALRARVRESGTSRKTDRKTGEF